MALNILIPIDDSDPSRSALDYAFSRHDTDTITVVHVIDPAEFAAYGSVEGGAMINFEEVQQQKHEEAKQLLKAARERASRHNIECSTETLTGRPSKAILDFIERNDVDHVILGSKGRTGASRVLLGSVAESVARRSPVPVTIVR